MFKLLVILYLGMFLTGCFSSEALDCSDYETKKLVMQIASKELNKSTHIAILGGLLQDDDELNLHNEKAEVNVFLSAVRTTKFNKDIGSYRCAANLNIKITNKEKGETETLPFPITYTSELADDGDEFYVTVFGL